MAAFFDIYSSCLLPSPSDLFHFLCGHHYCIFPNGVFSFCLPNSTSGVVKYIDSLSEDEIKRVGIPNGIPLVFKFKMEGGKLTPIPQLMAEAPLTGEFLEKKVQYLH